jgi:hypothetical protein
MIYSTQNVQFTRNLELQIPTGSHPIGKHHWPLPGWCSALSTAYLNAWVSINILEPDARALFPRVFFLFDTRARILVTPPPILLKLPSQYVPLLQSRSRIVQ